MLIWLSTPNTSFVASTFWKLHLASCRNISLKRSPTKSIERPASKNFELVLEQCGRLLRMRLREFFASNRQADRLSFKDVFRYAAKYCIISADSCERWFEYRDNHNDTVHDYGRGFAEGTLILLPGIIGDARELISAIESGNDD